MPGGTQAILSAQTALEYLLTKAPHNLKMNNQWKQ
jgi:hypothetical protein